MNYIKYNNYNYQSNLNNKMQVGKQICFSIMSEFTPSFCRGEITSKITVEFICRRHIILTSRRNDAGDIFLALNPDQGILPN